jgi:ATP-dependent DNA ligase
MCGWEADQALWCGGARPCLAFDLLWIDGEPLLDRPYLERRQRLEELRPTGPCGVLPRFPGPDAADLLAACAAHDVEGIVLKRRGRSIGRASAPVIGGR